MKFRFTCLSLLVAMLFLCQHTIAQSVGDYQSFSTGDWGNAARWSRWNGSIWVNPAPAPPNSGDGVITILSGHTITAGLTAEEGDQIVVQSGGVFQINTSFTVNDGAGTDLTVLGTLGLTSTLLSSAGTPSASISGVLDWTGGILALATTIAPAGTLNITGANKTLSSTLTNNGTANWSSSLIGFINGTLVNNASFIATGVTAFNSGGGTNSFQNAAAGTFSKTTNAGSVTFSVPVNNQGLIDVVAGTVISSSATGQFINAGVVNFGGGIGLTISGTAATNQLSPGGSFTGTGTLTVTATTDVNETLTLPSTVSLVLNSVANVIGGAGSLALSGPTTWNTGTLAVPTTINSGGTLALSGSSTKSLTSTLTNNGTINWTGFNLGFNGGTLVNNSGIVATGDNAFTTTPAVTNLFNNAAGGTFTKTTGVATTVFNIPVSNAGTLAISSGTVQVTGTQASFSNSGAIQFAGTALTLSGGVVASNSFNAGTSFSGTGTVTANTGIAVNAAITIPTPVTLVYNGTGQTYGGSGTLGITGLLNWGLGTLAVPTTVNAGGKLELMTSGKTLATTLVNNGTLEWTGGDVTFSTASLTNNNIFNISGTGNATVSGSPNTLTNTGTINKTSVGTTTLTSVTTNNSGTINISNGSLIKAGTLTPFTNTGTFNITSPGIFSYNTGGLGGELILNTGTVLTGTGIFRTNATTNINLALTTPVSLNVEIGKLTAQTYSGTGSLTINGNLDWGNGNFLVPLTIASGATMLSSAAKTVSTTLTNNGTIVLNDASGAGSITMNAGTIVNNGTINDNWTTGARNFGSSAVPNAFINNGTYFKSSAAFPTAFLVNVGVTQNTTGTFGGNGTMSFVNFNTNTGIISPGGNSPGLFGITANAVTAKTPTIQVQIVDGSGDGVGHDLLEMSAATNLSTAKLYAIDYATAPLNSYTVMTAPGLNGFTGAFATVVMPANFTYTIDNASNPSRVIINKIGVSLPVIWGAFTAQEKSGKVDLNWSTLQEDNTSHFFVERSTDGTRYSIIGRVAAQGSSNQEVFYHLNDGTPDITKTNFYRIQQVDLDGRSKYSAVRAVRFDKGKLVTVLLSPNPVVNTLQLSIQRDDLQLVLTGMNGAVLNIWKFQKGVHQVNLDKLPAGLYQIAVYDRNQRIETQQFIKQ